MTSDEVARSLGVSVRQVQRLVERGELREAGRVGRSVLVDADSVDLLRANGLHRGRPWNARTVWVAIDLLSGVATDELSSSQRWRETSVLHREGAGSSTDISAVTTLTASCLLTALPRTRVATLFCGSLRM
jgi:excisionase family DNA binding protein